MAAKKRHLEGKKESNGRYKRASDNNIETEGCEAVRDSAGTTSPSKICAGSF